MNEVPKLPDQDACNRFARTERGRESLAHYRGEALQRFAEWTQMSAEAQVKADETQEFIARIDRAIGASGRLQA